MHTSLIVLAALAVAGAAQAGPARTPAAQGAAVDAVFTTKAGKVVFVCDNSIDTRRAFVREFGAQEFVTAEEALTKNADWAQPKCVTPGEARRLQQALAKRS